MSAFSSNHAVLLERCRLEGLSVADRGRALEDVVAAAFAALPGVSVRARNAKATFENEEFDLVMANTAQPTGLPLVGPHFSVECKNWRQPVGSIELAWFATKLRRSGQRFGVLVAAQGVTGRTSDLTATHFEVAAALAEGQAIVILTLDELGWVSNGQQLAEVLGEKHACLVARRELRIFKQAEIGEVGVRLASVPTPDPERRELLEEFVEEVERDSDRVRSIDGMLEELWVSVDRFTVLENEPALSDVTEPEYNAWIERNMTAFRDVEDRLRRLGVACVSSLRSRPHSSWPVARLALGLELRAPMNLEAPPDGELARMLLSHWASLAKHPASHESDPAHLCILGWAIDSIDACRTDRWPPPSI